MGIGSRQTVSTQYFLGFHMAICHAPVEELRGIYVGERLAWTGIVTNNQSINISNPDLFGGIKKEGGISGTADVMFGASTQLQNPYLQSQLGNDVPAFRGVFGMTFHSGNFLGAVRSPTTGGYISAGSPYPKKWAMDLVSIPARSLNPTTAAIDTDSANGAHIIYETLTNTDWGAGVPVTSVDTASFVAASTTLHTEGLGLSMTYANPSQIWDFLEQVLSHINAVLYPDPSTGNYILTLIRNDYTVADLPVFNNANVLRVLEFQRPGYGDLVNEVVLHYRRKGELQDASIAVQNLASIQAQQGVISASVEMPGIDRDVIASRIALRELTQRATPLASVDLVVNRDGWELRPGDVIRFTWTQYNVADLILRVIEVQHGDLESGEILLRTVQDIFSFPTNSYADAQDPEWDDPITNPFIINTRRIVELSYWDAATRFQPGNFNAITATSAYVQSLAAPTTASFGFKVYSAASGATLEERLDAEYSSTATLVAAVDEQETTFDFETFSGSQDPDDYGQYFYIDNEVCRIDTIDFVNNRVTVGRGCNDTIPTTHAMGARLWFGGAEAIDDTEYATGETVDVRLLSQTALGILDISQALPDSVTMVGRFNKPYPAANVRINGFYFPANLAVPTVTVVWSHRDRTQQVAGLIDWYQGNIGPETGVTYTFTVYNDTTDVVLHQETGLTTTTASYTPTESNRLRIELETFRGAEESLYTFVHAFDYTFGPNTSTGSLVAQASQISGN